jgi:hypothetical protein
MLEDVSDKDAIILGNLISFFQHTKNNRPDIFYKEDDEYEVTDFMADILSAISTFTGLLLNPVEKVIKKKNKK